MKKIISLLILTVLCFAMLTSCDAVDTVKGWFGMGEEEVSTGLSEADVYLHKLYVNKDGSKVTLDFDVVGKVPGAGKFLNVTWTSDNEKVQIVNSTTAGYYTVDLPAVNEEEFTFKLTATITDEKGETKVRTYSFIMGKVDTDAIITEPEEGVEYKLFLTQATLGKRFYALATTQNNENKFINTTTKPTDGVIFQVEKVDGGYKFYTTVDGVKNYIYAKTTTNGTKVSKYLGFSTEDGSVLTYNAELGGVWTVTIDGYAYGIGTYNDFQTISLSEGKYFSATANGSSQFVMQVVTAEYANAQTEDKDLETYDDAATILDLLYALEDGKTMAGNFYFTGKITELDNYGNPTIVAEGHEDRPVLCYYLTDERFEVGATIKVYARTIKNYKGTYEFDNCELKSFTAPGGEGETPSTPSTTLGIVTSPEVGVAYKFGLLHGGNGNVNVYFNGQNYNSYAWYLAYTENTSEAVDVYLETVEGVADGYRLYFMNGDAKTYIVAFPRDGDTTKGTLKLDTAVPETYFTFNTEHNTLIYTSTTGEQFYLGSSGTYKSISCSAISYISNSDSYVAHLYAAGATGGEGEQPGGDNEGGNTPSEPETPAHTAPVVGTAYKLVIAQNGLGKNLYFGGSTESASVTYRLAMIEAVADAVDVYVEAVDGVEGAYKLYFVVDNVKTYIEVSEYQDNDNDPGYGKGTLKLVESTELYYTFDATAGTLIYTDAEGEDSYYLGTYGTFTTASVSNASYISGDKASSVDVSQFPARLVVVDAEGGDNEGGEGETPSTPVEPDDGVYTIPEVLASAANTQVVVKGTVSEIYQSWSDEHNNISFYITDDAGNRLLIFRTGTKAGIGDQVTVTGSTTLYNNVIQIAQGATTVIDVAHVCSEFTQATCLAKAVCVVCKLETGDVADHSYVGGTCSVCGHTEGTAEVKTTTASKTIAELITSEGWTSSTTKQSFNLDDVVSVKINGGNNTGKAYNGDHIRIYATDSPAGTITITLAEGYELVSVKVTAQTGTYAFLCLDDSTTDICNTTTAVSGSSVVLNSVKNGSDGKQVRVTAIEVVYKAAN